MVGVNEMIPLRYQMSEYDSAPISVMNALSLLVKREEVEAELISRVWSVLMDSCRGTGRGALLHMGSVISDEGRSMGLKATYLSGDQVFLGPGCSLYQALGKGGAAVAKVFGKRYIAMTGLSDDYLHFFDPLYGFSFPPGVEKDESMKERSNGKVKLSHLTEVVPAYREEWGDEREILILER